MMITVEQRDDLYGRILDRRSGIGEVWPADRLGREYNDEPHLVPGGLEAGGST